MIKDTLAIILAGGDVNSLSPLTSERAKASIPFGGKYRIIDFPLSNCMHSDLHRILVLTQYKSHSLQKHIRDGWSIYNSELGEYITLVPPQMRTGESWYVNDMDAIQQNLYLIERSGTRNIIIIPGEHIYRMDYASLLKFHSDNNADITVATMNVSEDKKENFDLVNIDAENRISGYGYSYTTDSKLDSSKLDTSKKSIPASMGIYVFSTELLIDIISKNESKENTDKSMHSLGNKILPGRCSSYRIFSYNFGGSSGRVTQDNYWRNLSSLDEYYEASMDLITHNPSIDLYQSDWPIRTYTGQQPPAKTSPGEFGNEGIFINSIVGGGTIINGGSVQNSVLFNHVYVSDEALIRNAVLFEGVKVGKSTEIQNSIIDKDVLIPDNEKIGIDIERDRKRFKITEKGIVIIPKGYVFDI